MSRIAYYEATIHDFTLADEDAILGLLTLHHASPWNTSKNTLGRVKFACFNNYCVPI